MLSPHGVERSVVHRPADQTPSQAERFIYRYDWFIATQTHRSHMDIRRKITQGKSLTPTEQQLGQTALAMGEDVRGLSIKVFAACANVSVASVHRFCKKLGLEGFKDLKVELIRQATEAGNRRDVDINFPFDATSTPAQVMERMEGLYQTTLAETQELLDPAQLDYAAKLVMRADTVDIYTGSHNLYPAGMFRDRLLSAGKSATCYGSVEAQVRTALASGPRPCGDCHLLQRPCPQPQGDLADPQQSTRPGHRHRHTVLRPHSPRLCRLSHGERPREYDAPHHAVRQPHRRAIRARFALQQLLRQRLRPLLRIPGALVSLHPPPGA